MSVITDAVRLHRERAKSKASVGSSFSRSKSLTIRDRMKATTAIKEIKETGFKGFKIVAKKFFRRAYRKLNLKYLIPLSMVALYTVVGGAMFLSMEKEVDQNDLNSIQAKVNRIKADIVDDLDFDLVRIRSASVPMHRRDIKRRIADALDNYVSKYGEATGKTFSNETVWDIWWAMYYAGTIYTTIGYGNIYCKTVGGQVATIFYSLIGIPLVLTTLNDLGIFLFKLIRSCLQRGQNLIDRLKANRRKRQAAAKLQKQIDEQSVDSKSEDIEANRSINKSIDESSDEEQLDIGLSEEEKNEIMNIPVSAALFVTLGWIFLCSGIFCIWETSWTYWTSVYFFFISLTTIGLGDITPEYPKAMILMFGVVLVGLSLVSMMINVVQMRLEELYVQLLMKILMEYQNRMKNGSGEEDATMGMIDAFNDSKAAKLLKLLPKSKMNNVMQQFNEAAKAQGIEVPSVLQDVDFDKGLPRCLTITDAAKDDDARREQLVAVLEKADEKVQQQGPLQKVIMETLSSQTSLVIDEKGIQTTLLQLVDNTSQFSVQMSTDTGNQTEGIDSEQTETQTEEFTEYAEVDAQTVDAEIKERWAQTDDAETVNEQIQVKPDTAPIEIQVHIGPERSESMQTDAAWGVKNEEQQTKIVQFSDCEAQVRLVPENDSEVQTDAAHQLDADIQTELPVEMSTEMQTDINITIDSETQTDRTEPEPEAEPDHHPHLELLKKAFKRRKADSERRHSAGSSSGALKTLKDRFRRKGSVEAIEEETIDEEEQEDEAEDESEEEKETLQWDPIDGMHAEKQRSVSALKNMFEVVPAPEKENPKILRRHSTKAYGSSPSIDKS